MKASELILELQRMAILHGDVEVTLHSEVSEIHGLEFKPADEWPGYLDKPEIQIYGLV